MKRFFSLSACQFFSLLFFAVTVQAQITNGVKISALPSATTLGGGELVPVVQSGTTKMTTVGAIQLLPQSYAVAASNSLQTQINASAASTLSLSNYLYNGIVQSNSVAISYANQLFTLTGTTYSTGTNTIALWTSGQFAALTEIIGLNATTAANALNFGTNLLQREIDTLQAAAGATNGGSVSFTRIRTPTFQMPSVVDLGTTTTNVNVDAANGNFQKVFVSYANAAGIIIFKPINFADGDNLWLEVVATNGIPGQAGVSGTVTNGTIDMWTSTTFSDGKGNYSQLNGSVKEAMINWQIMGASLVTGMTVHP